MFNTQLRANSKNDFEKDLFKLLNNAIFGKSCEDKRKHCNVKMALTEQQAKRYLSKPSFDQFYIMSENKVLIKMRKSVVILDKPMYLALTVLEISKKLMYKFYYEILKEHYKDNINLVYTDTDSLIPEIRTEDIYKDF